jgi:hypothetical protein
VLDAGVVLAGDGLTGHGDVDILHPVVVAPPDNSVNVYLLLYVFDPVQEAGELTVVFLELGLDRCYETGVLLPQGLDLLPQLSHILHESLLPLALHSITTTIVQEGASLGKPASPVHAIVSASPGVALGAGVVQAWEAVTSHGVVDLVATIGKLTVSVLVELTDSGHFDLLVFLLLLKLAPISAAETRLTEVAVA